MVGKIIGKNVLLILVPSKAIFIAPCGQRSSNLKGLKVLKDKGIINAF